MNVVYIESPFAAPTHEGLLLNRAYAFACMRDSLARGEAPLASHLLWPQVLDDTKPDGRALGMECGFTWSEAAGAAHAFYFDLGWNSGMKAGLKRATERGALVYTRSLGAPWSDIAPSSAELMYGRPAPRTEADRIADYLRREAGPLSPICKKLVEGLAANIARGVR